MIVTGLAPLVDDASDRLILGTFPSEMSLGKKQYYANPRNQFWKIMDKLFGADYSAEYETKTSELLRQGVALWDVLQSCERIGSSDKNIRHAQPNDLCSFLENHPRIVQAFFNGICPRELVHKLLPDLLHNERIGFLVLPSSSSNNSHIQFDEKARHWSVLKKK